MFTYIRVPKIWAFVLYFRNVCTKWLLCSFWTKWHVPILFCVVSCFTHTYVCFVFHTFLTLMVATISPMALRHVLHEIAFIIEHVAFCKRKLNFAWHHSLILQLWGRQSRFIDRHSAFIIPEISTRFKNYSHFEKTKKKCLLCCDFNLMKQDKNTFVLLYSLCYFWNRTKFDRSRLITVRTIHSRDIYICI